MNRKYNLANKMMTINEKRHNLRPTLKMHLTTTTTPLRHLLTFKSSLWSYFSSDLRAHRGRDMLITQQFHIKKIRFYTNYRVQRKTLKKI